MHPVTPWLHDRAWRNSNPGNLRPRSGHPPWPGQCAIDTAPGGPFAMFVTPTDGWAALALWCLDARYLRGMKTAVQMISVFAPPSENDTQCYAQSVAAKCGTGDLDLTAQPTLMRLCRAIAHYEDARAPWSDSVIAAGMMLAAVRWPGFRAARLAPLPIQPGYPAPKPADETAVTEALNEAELAKDRPA